MAQEEVPMEWRQKFLGARGINMFLLATLTDATTNPLGPDNPLIVGLGLLTGLPGFGTGRFNITALSPATGSTPYSGNIGDSNVGGHVGPELKYAGFDHLVIRGQSSVPVYLVVANDNIEIRDASHLWGKDTWETQQIIKRESGDERTRVICIGPAGENLVRMACFITGLKDAAGGSGLGSVAGAKRLKAIAVRGTKDVSVAYPKELVEYFSEQTKRLMSQKWVKALGYLGTPLRMTAAKVGGWGEAAEFGVEGRVEEAEGLNAEKLLPYSLGMSACLGCAIHCRHRHLIKEGRYAGTRGEGPEYGALVGQGAALRNYDIESVTYLNDLCNRLGMEVNAGGMLSFAIELFESGLIGIEETGRPLKWGDRDTIEVLTQDIAYRRGFGDVLAEGKFALDRLPPEARRYLGFIKGAATSRREWKTVTSFVLSQLTASLPAHVYRSRPGIDILGLPAGALKALYGRYVDPDIKGYQGKAFMVWWHELLYAICDALGCCRFLTVFNSPHAPQYEEYRELLRLTTGWDLSIPKLQEIAERIYTVERLLLGRFGVGMRKDDRMPEIWLEVAGSEAAESKAKFEELLDEYYQLHSWDQNGIPTPETLERLGIVDLASLKGT
ncbi:MAG: hypothetical protein HY664_02915 [Chloroflexi bacterium]|nr:hypothetical protein [Chloroflexota bacterium]